MSRKKRNRGSSTAKQTGSKPPPPTADPSNPAIPSGGGQKLVLLRVAQLLFAIALGISVYLAYTSMTSGQIAGCGEGTSCDEVLTSRWAYWFGLPVSLPAALFYAIVLGASFFAGPQRTVAVQRKSWSALVGGAFVILAAAFWFVGLQAVILDSWCTWCLRAHIAGSVGAVSVLVAAPFVIRSKNESPLVFGVAQRAWPAVAGMLSLVPLVAGQYLGKAPGATVVVTDNAVTQVESIQPVSTNATDSPPENRNPTETSAPPTQTPPAEPSRLFTLHNKFQFDLYSVPLMGDPSAPHVMVSLFDYTCSHCRHMHERLTRVQNLYSNELAIVVMPMPLDASCNPMLSSTGPDHVNACQYARIALAVFKEKNERFAEFENWFFEPAKPRPLTEVHAKAKALAEVENFDAVVNHPGVNAWLNLGIQVFQLNYQQSGQRILPMLMAGQGIMAGQAETDEALINFLVQNLGLPKKESADQ